MPRKTTKNNRSEKEDKLKARIWLGEDGIIRVKTGELMDEKVIESLAKDFQDIAKGLAVKEE